MFVVLLSPANLYHTKHSVTLILLRVVLAPHGLKSQTATNHILGANPAQAIPQVQIVNLVAIVELLLIVIVVGTIKDLEKVNHRGQVQLVR